jgi:hypothetical protein
MSFLDRMRTIVSLKAAPSGSLGLEWSDGTEALIDISHVFKDRAFAGLADPAEFAGAEIGDWGQSVTWPGGAELGADTLWRETLSATGHQDARNFLEWRLRHGLSLTAAAEALGISRRMVAYYSNGEKAVPKAILLACRGWEAGQAA